MYVYVCPYVRVEQLGFHWTNFREIWYLTIFRKSIERRTKKKNKSDKISRHKSKIQTISSAPQTNIFHLNYLDKIKVKK